MHAPALHLAPAAVWKHAKPTSCFMMAPGDFSSLLRQSTARLFISFVKGRPKGSPAHAEKLYLAAATTLTLVLQILRLRHISAQRHEHKKSRLMGLRHQLYRCCCLPCESGISRFEMLAAL